MKLKLKRNRMSLFAFALVCLSALVISLFVTIRRTGWSDGFKEIFCGQTEFSSKFSDRSFSSINIGDPIEDAVSKLGPPLHIRDLAELGLEGQTIWFFSFPAIRDKSGTWGDCNYAERSLTVSNGVVVTIHRNFYVD